MGNWSKIENIEEWLAPELSRPINVAEIQDDYLISQIIANEEECFRLAKRFDLVELKSFSANVKISRLSSQPIIVVEGTLNAKVVQQCVVTLEPILNNISYALVCKYSEAQKLINTELVDFDVMTEDPPEFIVDGQFDIGIILTEYLGVELDPFPRSLGANYDTTYNMINANKSTSGNSNPFEVLRKLK